MRLLKQIFFFGVSTALVWNFNIYDWDILLACKTYLKLKLSKQNITIVEAKTIILMSFRFNIPQISSMTFHHLSIRKISVISSLENLCRLPIL